MACLKRNKGNIMMQAKLVQLNKLLEWQPENQDKSSKNGHQRGVLFFPKVIWDTTPALA